jgi:hypothetical protein
MNWKSIWRVPAIAIIGGYIGWYILVRLLTFTHVVQSDGTVLTDYGRQVMIYILYTVLFVGITGFLFLRKMSRKEIFWSATVVVLLNLLLTAASYLVGPMSGTDAIIFMRLSMPFEWMDFPHTLIHYITGEYTWLGSVLRGLMPYLYLFFGKKN